MRQQKREQERESVKRTQNKVIKKNRNNEDNANVARMNMTTIQLNYISAIDMIKTTKQINIFQIGSSLDK